MNSAILDLAVEHGVSPNSLKKWRKRGKVPHKYRLPLLEAAQRKGVALSSRDFEFKVTSKKRSDRGSVS